MPQCPSILPDFTRVVDLSHPLHDGIPVFPGDRPLPAIELYPPDQNGVTLSTLTFGSHWATHIDAPRHVRPSGRTLDQFLPEQFMGSALLIDKTEQKSRHPRPIELTPGEIRLIESETPRWVIFRTGWDHHFGQPCYFHNHPGLSPATSRLLTTVPIVGVGLDSPGVDPPGAASLEIHCQLADAGRLILENLTGLDQLPVNRFFLIALPLRLALEAAPVRALALF